MSSSHPPDEKSRRELRSERDIAVERYWQSTLKYAELVDKYTALAEKRTGLTEKEVRWLQEVSDRLYIYYGFTHEDKAQLISLLSKLGAPKT